MGLKDLFKEILDSDYIHSGTSLKNNQDVKLMDIFNNQLIMSLEESIRDGDFTINPYIGKKNWVKTPIIKISHKDFLGTSFYLGYIFDANLSGFYLALFNKLEWDVKQRKYDYTTNNKILKDSREKLKNNFSNEVLKGLTEKLDLKNNGLPRKYVDACILAKKYEQDLPSDEILKRDLDDFIDLYLFLARNYESENISKQEWLDIFDSGIISHETADLLKAINSLNGIAYQKELSNYEFEGKYIDYANVDFINNELSEDVYDISNFLSKNIIISEFGRNNFYNCFFYGRKLEDDLEFILHSQLIEALNNFDFTNVKKDLDEEKHFGYQDLEIDEVLEDEIENFSFYDYLVNQEYLFDKETIENYLLSLKVKPFAILTGNSGTGKTKLSQLFAQYLSLEDIDYQEEMIEVPDSFEPTVEIEENDEFNTPVEHNTTNIEGGNYVEYSKEVKQSFIKEGKFQISSLYPFKEYYGTCSAELNGVNLVVKISSENIIIFKNSLEIMNYLSETYKGYTSHISFKINSLDVSKAVIENYVPKNHILEGEVSKTVFNRIKLPINRKNGFPGTTSDFYPIKYEVPCRVIVDNKVEGVCTLRSYAWIELADKNSYHVESLKNQDSFYLKIFLDTFEYTQNQTTDFSTVGDYIDYKSYKKNLGLDLSDKKLDKELNEKLKNIFNFDDDFDDDSLEEIKNILNLTGYETEEELIKIFSEAMDKKKDSSSEDLSDEEDLESNSNSNSSINENKNPKVVKYKKIIDFNSSNSIYKIIPVGANWTENRHIVGYYNVITNEYQDTPAYQLIKQANESSEPHFLILDEMNLSHVERYFADFLSAIESGEKIPLYGEKELTLPENLFIIGTVNVDETTYMFSPKVLDRANVIEFETYSASDYMKNRINLNSPEGDISYLENPLAGKEIREYGIDELRELFEDVTVDGEPFWNILTEEIFSFQKTLKESGFDFGFRVINEIVRFMAVAWEYENKPDEFNNWKRYFDACIKQKLLPKLHGSEKIIGETLDKLYTKCLDNSFDSVDMAKYPQSYKKLKEMREVLRKQRYVSFIN